MPQAQGRSAESSESSPSTEMSYHREYWSAPATLTKYHSSGSWKSKFKVLPDSVARELCSWGAGDHLLAVSSHGLSSLCNGKSDLGHPFLVRPPLPLDQGPVLMISRHLNCLPKGPISKHSHPGSYGFNTHAWGDTIQFGTQGEQKGRKERREERETRVASEENQEGEGESSTKDDNREEGREGLGG